MHIAFHYPGLNLGGQQTATLHLMAALKEMGHRATWIYHQDGALLDAVRRVGTAQRILMPKFNAGRFGVQRVVNRVVYRVGGTLQLRRYCVRHGVDALLSANTPDSILGARVYATSGVRHYRLLGGSPRQVEPYWMEEYAALGIDRGTLGYFGWPAALEQLREVGVDPRKFAVLPFAVDASRHFPLPEAERAAVRASLGIPTGALVIGWIGRVADNMQVWGTVELARRLRASGFNDFFLLFAGGGDALPRLRAELQRDGLEAQAVVTGWVPYDEINAVTNAMDVVPLLEPDPHGGSIVREAMAAGRIALSVDGPSAVQRDFMKREHSILVPSVGYLDHAVVAVIRLARSPAERLSLGTAAATYAASQMSFRRQAEALVDGLTRLR